MGLIRLNLWIYFLMILLKAQYCTYKLQIINCSIKAGGSLNHLTILLWSINRVDIVKELANVTLFRNKASKPRYLQLHKGASSANYWSRPTSDHQKHAAENWQEKRRWLYQSYTNCDQETWHCTWMEAETASAKTCSRYHQTPDITTWTVFVNGVC